MINPLYKLKYFLISRMTYLLAMTYKCAATGKHSDLQIKWRTGYNVFVTQGHRYKASVTPRPTTTFSKMRIVYMLFKHLARTRTTTRGIKLVEKAYLL